MDRWTERRDGQTEWEYGMNQADRKDEEEYCDDFFFFFFIYLYFAQFRALVFSNSEFHITIHSVILRHSLFSIFQFIIYYFSNLTLGLFERGRV
jgi:hypothetical protein